MILLIVRIHQTGITISLEDTDSGHRQKGNFLYIGNFLMNRSWLMCRDTNHSEQRLVLAMI